MEAPILHNAIFPLVCIFLSPFAVTSQRDSPPGNIPIVNPTTPGGSTPIVNPTSPNPSFTTSPNPPFTTSPNPPFTTSPNPPFTTSPPATTGPPATGGGGGSWCVANSGASETALQVALDYACGYGVADCLPIQPNGPCYEPNTVRDHASYAFNDYYQKNPAPTSCVFGGTAQLTNTDPSHGNCRYASSGGNPMSPPKSMPPPALSMTPPSIPTPVNPYPPVGNGYGSEPGYDYGNEPIGPPNSAGIMPLSLFTLVIGNCLVLLVSMANNL